MIDIKNTVLLDIPVIFGWSLEIYLLLAVIAFPLFFFCKWLVSKYFRKAGNRNPVTWIGALILTPFLLYGGLLLLLFFGISYTPAENFEKKKWLNNKETRFRMAGDIVKSKMLIGKDTSEVKEILGSASRGGDSNKWIYDLGMGSGGLGFLFHYLELELDENKKVVSVEHVKTPD